MLFLVIIPCFLCFVYAWRRHRKFQQGSLPPACGLSWPIIGLAHLWIRGSFWTRLLDIQKDCSRQGGVTLLHAGINPKYTCYAVSDPVDCGRISSSCPEKSFLLEDSIKSIFGETLLTLPGSLWERYRKPLDATFEELTTSVGDLNNDVSLLVKEFKNHVGKGPFEYMPFIRTMVMRIMLKTVIGQNQDDEKSTLDLSIQSAENLSAALYKRHKNIFMHKKILFNLTKGRALQNDAMRHFTDVVYGQIVKRKLVPKEKLSESGKNKDASFNDLLDGFLELESKGLYPNEENLIKEMISMIFSGYVTMVNALSFVLHTLASNMDVQKKVYDEINTLNKASTEFAAEDLAKLTYLEAVIMETLRLYPPVTAVARTITKEVKLRKYTLDRGSNCLFAVYAMNRHSVWGSDKNKFKPDRWLTESYLNKTSFGSFGVGKRNCIGKSFALCILKVFVVQLLSEYIVSSEVSMDCKHEILMSLKEYKIVLNSRIS